MHEVILKALSSLHGLSSEEDLSGFLRGLKPTAKSLWQAYRSSFVNISYRKPTVQATYMLRYFLPYAEVTRVVLDELHRKEVLPFQEELLYVNLFGCGPAPELYGILQFLKSRFSRSEMIIAHLLDIASESWIYSRRITLDYFIPTLWDNHLIEALAIPSDLSMSGSSTAITITNNCSNAFGKASLVMFQNCLNELPHSVYNVATENMLALLRMMKPGKVMVVIDRAGYQGVVELLSRICSLAEEHVLAKVLLFDQGRALDCNPILKKMPPVLTANLLVRKTPWSENAPDEDRLICARWVRYHCLALQRV